MEEANIQKRSLWVIYDPYLKKVLVSLPYEINSEKWKNEPDARKIPQNRKMTWSENFNEAALFPTACAKVLRETFKMVGRSIELREPV
jgi:hypothetical protein